MSPFLHPERLVEHRQRNLVHSALLVAGMSAIVLMSAALLGSWTGAIAALVSIAMLAIIGPRVPPEAIMRLYNAVPVGARHGQQLLHMVEVLADRAELPRHPRLYVVPSATLNAFATGSRDHAAIAVTEGLLRRLSMRELAGVIAHEMSHIRNNDLTVMALADALTRFTQLLAYLAVFLAFVNIPTMIFGFTPMSWGAIALLYFAPFLTSLLQLALSRTREYDADIEAAGLTGDPDGLVSALGLLEQYQGRFWEDLMLPVPARRIPYPSLLRSHPDTAERIARLRHITIDRSRIRPMAHGAEPMFTLVGLGPAAMTPRRRPMGLWY